MELFIAGTQIESLREWSGCHYALVIVSTVEEGISRSAALATMECMSPTHERRSSLPVKQNGRLTINDFPAVDLAWSEHFRAVPNPSGIELRLESSLFLGNAVEWEAIEILETTEPVFGYKGLLESKLEGFNEGSKFYRAAIIFPELE